MTYIPKYTDLVAVRSAAINELNQSTLKRVRGSKVDLTLEEIQLLAVFQGSIRVLGRLGALKPCWIKAQELDQDNDWGYKPRKDK